MFKIWYFQEEEISVKSNIDVSGRIRRSREMQDMIYKDGSTWRMGQVPK